ncbi:MAG: HAMP domain-containing histidine kinase [Patescibacteria group bacterium]|nr:HAMP domain-containing histidine kinase [Patescibacteria group bacterium]
MFRSARIKLTAWYLVIIMLISIAFSVAIYKVLVSELDRVERIQRLRIEHQLPERIQIIPPTNLNELPRSLLLMDPQIIEETKERLKIVLIFINLAILGASAAAGYFLAGRTLRPIAQMLDEHSRFISDASHELRTPLTTLRSEIEVNLRDKNLTLPGSKKLLRSNLEEVNNLQALTDRLIKHTQYQKGGGNLNITQMPLTAVIDGAIKKVTSLAKNKKIIIENKTSNYHIEGNKPALIELVVILLDNAIKYSPQKTKIKLSSTSEGGLLLIHIEDQGIGINDKDLPHLFTRFYRADKSRTKSGASGYGLGLSIAKKIIDRHGGSIKVKSTPGKGSTFIVQIPFKQPGILI